MDIKAFPALIVGVVVALVLAGAVLPVFAETTSAEDTFTNDGYFRMSEITDTDEDYTILWDYTNPYVFNSNGEDVTIPFGSTNVPVFPYSVIFTDSWAVRFISTNSGAQIDLAVFGGYSNLVWGVSTTDNKNASFVMSEGTATITKEGATPLTLTYTSVFVPAVDGPYVMKKSTDSAYLNADSPIYSTGRTGAVFGGSNVNLNLHVQGTIDDGATVSFIYPTEGYTISNLAVNADEVGAFKDLYTFDSITFDITDSSDNTVSATYSQVVVPYEVTAEKAVHPDGALAVMLNVLPLLAIAGLVTGAVVWFVVRKG